MTTNATPQYYAAEKRYLRAETIEEKIACLEEMIREAPGHKGGENMRANLRTRLKKLRESQEKRKKVGKGPKGIRKEGFQVVLVGLPNSGKSKLMGKLTNAFSPVSIHPFTTKSPVLGTMYFQGVHAQIIDLPSIGSKDFDYSILHGADCVLFVIDRVVDLEQLEKIRSKMRGKILIVFNKIDSLQDRRKTEAYLQSKRIHFVMVSSETGEGVDILKDKIVREMGIIRVFMKEPGKKKSEIPAVLRQGSTVRDVAEGIYKGFSKTVKEARLTGPSGKFVNQKVGLHHICKDMDVVEFKT